MNQVTQRRVALKQGQQMRSPSAELDAARLTHSAMVRTPEGVARFDLSKVQGHRLVESGAPSAMLLAPLLTIEHLF